MYVLDTCVLSEVRKIRLGRADPGVAAFAEAIDAGDLYISAATALVHGMAVVTRNVADFEPTVVPVINPWTS